MDNSRFNTMEARCVENLLNSFRDKKEHEMMSKEDYLYLIEKVLVWKSKTIGEKTRVLSTTEAVRKIWNWVIAKS